MQLTPLGKREIIVAAVVFCAFSIILYNLYRFHEESLYLAPIPFLAVMFAWTLWFFRDPPRRIPSDPGCIVSPADGTVTHLDEAEEPEYIGGRALRCSIFLSIFDVHMNRTPAAGVVEHVVFRPGAFFDARREESLAKNQNQDIGIRTAEPGLPAKMVVRQSAGAIARRIVCPVREGQDLARGQRYGMIKFGSRTTLFLSPEQKIEWRVRVGDKVKAGETILAGAPAAGGSGGR